MNVCSIEGCGKKLKGRGYCHTHLTKFRRQGEITPKRTPTREERFWEKVNISGQDECWIWSAHKDAKGYGKFGLGGRSKGMGYAHRVAFELCVGEILPNHAIDHLCYTPSCVNPRHLRSVPRSWNQQNLSGPVSTSVTGIRGVSWDKGSQRYRCFGQVNGKTKYLGTFTDKHEAGAFMDAWYSKNYPGYVRSEEVA